MIPIGTFGSSAVTFRHASLDVTFANVNRGRAAVKDVNTAGLASDEFPVFSDVLWIPGPETSVFLD